MDAKLQRRIQRYGWDLASTGYESLWQAQLAEAQAARAGIGVTGSGWPERRSTGTDLSRRMIDAAERRARELGLSNCSFLRMDAEHLSLPDARFDVALCGLGLMYVPDPGQALREMRRVLRPGGRISLAVCGERQNCCWSSVIAIVDAEVESEVCPLFFRLGLQDALARACAEAGFENVKHRRITTTLVYADSTEACNTVFVAGPVALAWSRFNDEVRTRARPRYLEAIASWRHGAGYRIPGEFVITAAVPSPAV